MTETSQAIEVEVLEIDGITPTQNFNRQNPVPSSPPWMQWQSRVGKLNRRWRPLWIFLGAILLVLMLTVGVVVGAVVLIFKILRRIVRVITG
ncbi:MAG: hypothetical protein HC845_01495 [Akkermansiaceae bacterium]|nr:hypothetical protein [Akkermansiaceae bacterium]NJR42003.1 hypothetical protein [Akkermansiaceae bacterium]